MEGNSEKRADKNSEEIAGYIAKKGLEFIVIANGPFVYQTAVSRQITNYSLSYYDNFNGKMIHLLILAQSCTHTPSTHVRAHTQTRTHTQTKTHIHEGPHIAACPSAVF